MNKMRSSHFQKTSKSLKFMKSVRRRCPIISKESLEILRALGSKKSKLKGSHTGIREMLTTAT